ncbi:MAG: HEAT repeat domain-containing protein, partial [Bacteroidota bacterium]
RIWTTRLALTVVLLAAGFVLGRQDQPLIVLQEGVPPEAVLAQAQEATGSYFGGISGMQVDPLTGQVEVRYQTIAERVVRGVPTDPAVTTLLEGALLDKSNPAVRLDALRTIVSTAAQTPAPDALIVDALVTVLTDEPNEGLRLQALRALGLLHNGQTFGEMAKAAVIEVMLHDANSALRIEALQLLTQNAAGTADLTPYLEAATADTNAFIQRRAERLLGRLPETNPNR